MASARRTKKMGGWLRAGRGLSVALALSALLLPTIGTAFGGPSIVPRPDAGPPSQSGSAGLSGPGASVLGPTFPPTVQHVVSLNITNTQSIATTAPFVQQVPVNSSQYAAYEMGNLQNVAFYDAHGTLIPSWIESGANASATSTIFWLNLSAGIPARSTITVYEGFHNLSVMNNGTTGEAPELSTTYAQFDDGTAVFGRLYADFAGTSLPSGWSSNTAGSGTLSVNDGLTVGTTGGTFSGSVALSNISTSAAAGEIVEGFASAHSNGGNSHIMALVASTSVSFGSIPSGWGLQGYQPDQIGFQNGLNSGGLLVEDNNGGTPSVVASSSVGSAGPEIIGEHGDDLYVNYSVGATISGSILGKGYLAVDAGSGTTSPSITYQWMRVRPYPPNGQMPVVGSISGPDWTNRTTGHGPPARSMGAMDYDASDHYVLLFGGGGTSVELNDSWKYFGGTWSHIRTTVAPSARRGMAMAFDPMIGKIVLFGGANVNAGLNDTWEYHAGFWTQLFPPTSPPARASAKMVYDPKSGDLVLFAGTSNYCCSNAGLDDLWLFLPNATWVQAHPTTLPSQRNEFGFAENKTAGTALVFGGWQPGGSCGQPINDSWTLQKGTWRAVRTPSGLSPRQGAALTWSFKSGFVMFGGLAGSCGTAQTFYGETWRFSGHTWSLIPTAGVPQARAYAEICDDARDGYLLMFGGASASGDLSDTWSFG